MLAVGASTAQPDTLSARIPGSPCAFSATQGLTFFAPGCGLDQANPFTHQPTCCGNGTSQASAFAAAVLVALMSYDPTLTYDKAEQLLVSTATDGNLNVAAAFEADGLSAIVTTGTANIPKPPAPTPPASSPTSKPSTRTKPATQGLVVRQVGWKAGVLTLVVSGLGKGRLSVQLDYAHHPPRELSTRRTRTLIRTPRPRLVLLRVFIGKHESGSPLTTHVT